MVKKVLFPVLACAAMVVMTLACGQTQYHVPVTVVAATQEDAPTEPVRVFPSKTPVPTTAVTPSATFTQTPTPTPSLTPSRTPTASITPTPTISSTPTQSQTPSITPTPTISPTPTTGDIHGVIRYKCNNQPVYTYHYAVIFMSGSQWSLAEREADENGEFWFRKLDPGPYSVYQSRTDGTVFTIGEGEFVNVVAGKTHEITLYSVECPLLVLLYPVGGEEITETRPVFQWKSYRPGSRYTVKVEIVGDQYGGMQTTSGLDSFLESPWEFVPGKTYQWYVCVDDPNGYGCLVASFWETFKVGSP